MTIETFAGKFRLKITRDDCNDKIIQGKHGQLYLDDGALCAMWLDARPINRSRLEQLGGKLWMGDISPNAHGRRVQDVKIAGIRPERYAPAIRLTGAKRKREMSEAQRAVLTRAQAALPERFRHRGERP
jgi:hypothetical protein